MNLLLRYPPALFFFFFFFQAPSTLTLCYSLFFALFSCVFIRVGKVFRPISALLILHTDSVFLFFFFAMWAWDRQWRLIDTERSFLFSSLGFSFFFSS